MKCPKCNKKLSAKAKTCKHCGTKISRKSDKMIRRMTVSGRIAMASGCLLVVMAAVGAFYGAYIIAGVLAAVGGLLMLIGKNMG